MLTAAQLKFCKGLLAGKGKREAAIEAGYSIKSAAWIAYDTLQVQEVKDYLAKHHKRTEDEVAIYRDRVLHKMLNFATANSREIFADDWSVLPKSQVPTNVQDIVINARTWEGGEQGKGSTVKLVNQIDACKSFLKAFPAPVTQAESLEGAAADVDAELAELMGRLEPPDDGPG